jgi:hypothetical protein
VEYLSSSFQEWIEAVVTAINPDGTLDLDVKSSAPLSKVRRKPSNSSGKVPLAVSKEQNKVLVSHNTAAPYSNTFSDNHISLHSAQERGLIPTTPARKSDLLAEGAGAIPYFAFKHHTHHLCDAEPRASELATAKKLPPVVTIGSEVEYLSSSYGAWISATVLGLNPDGTFDLDVKPRVAAHLIRLQRPGPGNYILSSVKKSVHVAY